MAVATRPNISAHGDVAPGMMLSQKNDQEPDFWKELCLHVFLLNFRVEKSAGFSLFTSTFISLALASDILLTSGWHLLFTLGNRSDCDNKLLSFSGMCTPQTCLGILSQLHFIAISVYTVCLLALCSIVLLSTV